MSLFFILGIRASGTSILKRLVEKCPEVSRVEFEPHDLMFSCSTLHFKRYASSSYHQKTISRFEKGKGVYGAKIALNTGIEALNWRFLDRVFQKQKPKYIFVIRNEIDNFLSLKNKDEQTVKGVLPKDIFLPIRKIIVKSFTDFYTDVGRSRIFNYDNFVVNPDQELEKVANLLNITFPKDVSDIVVKPKFWRCHV